MDTSNTLFQQLKPPCVALNQTLLLFQGHKATPSQVTDCLERLLKTLQHVNLHDLNPRLAEYVFIPLSFVIKAGAQLPVRAIEIVFTCLALLLEHGWGKHLAGPLASQLLILLSVTADRNQKQNASSHIQTAELLVSIFQCLRIVYEALSHSPTSRAHIQQDTAVPQLGHSLSVILDGLGATQPSTVQLEAVRALQALLWCVTDSSILGGFLPGVTSALTKVLTPSTTTRRAWQVLQTSLDITRYILSKTISDHVVETAHSKEPKPSGNVMWSDSWVAASSGQLKLALANINRLHSHERKQVRAALLALNLVILSDCCTTMANCRSLALETAIVLACNTDLDASPQLEGVIQSHPEVLVALQTTFRSWMLSLPRMLESADDDKKMKRMGHLQTACKMLLASESPAHVVQEMITSALPNLVAIIFKTQSIDKTALSQTPVVGLEDLPLAVRIDRSQVFPEVLAETRQQVALLNMVKAQLAVLPSAAAEDLARSCLDLVRAREDDQQFSVLWLALSVATNARHTPDDDLLNFDNNDDHESRRELILDDIYDLSSNILNNEDHDWRSQCLALEAVALQAASMKENFRNELIDILYPVLHFLGSDKPRLRRHAMVCLNSITDSCGYVDVKDLVVSNADYLVNAVALKLNAFEVAPQGPQVLLMMVKLAGPSLVPFLGDTVDSIFAVLEDYHGYTRLVELLFAVLGAVAEQGAAEPRLHIESSPGNHDRRGGSDDEPLITVSELATFLRLRRTRAAALAQADHAANDSQEPTPQKPWKSVSDADEDDTTQDLAAAEAAQDVIPAKSTYTLLQRIASLTAHYLASPSPHLRASLLQLLARHLFPALSAHENSFLPLINTLWPEILARLSFPSHPSEEGGADHRTGHGEEKEEEEEVAVVTAALAAMTAMARLAGPFMRTRFDAAWPALGAVERRARRLLADAAAVAGEASRARPRGTRSNAWTSSTPSGSAPRLDGIVAGAGGSADPARDVMPAATALRRAVYVEPSARALWAALRALLLAVVASVGIGTECFEEVLKWLAPLGELSEAERAALEAVDPDTVWLAMLREDRERLVVPAVLRESKVRWAGVDGVRV